MKAGVSVAVAVAAAAAAVAAMHACIAATAVNKHTWEEPQLTGYRQLLFVLYLIS